MSKGAFEIGRLRHRIVLEQDVLTPGEAGSFVRSRSIIAETWAAFDNIREKLDSVAEQRQQVSFMRITTRFHPEYKNADWIRLGDRVFAVDTVSDRDDRQRFLCFTVREQTAK